MNRPAALRSCLALTGLALTFLAQYLFTGEAFTRTRDTNYRNWNLSQTVACGLLAVSACLAATAFVRTRRSPSTDASIPRPGPEFHRTHPRLSRILAGPLSCYAGSLTVYWTFGESWLVRGLWTAGAAWLVLELWRTNRISPSAPDHPVKPLIRPLACVEWLTVAAIAVAGFDLRYWRLTELPVHFDDDVSLMGWFSLDMLHHGDARWFGMSPSGHVLSSHQLLIWSMRLFGENHYGLVMISVLLGTLTLPVVYLLGRETFGRWAGFTAMALLAGSYTHIHFSRIMFGPGATFFTTLAFYAFFRGWRTQRDLPFACSGLALGIALLTYDSARVGPVVIAALFVTSWFWKPEYSPLRISLRHWTLLGAGALVGFGPMLAFVIQDFSEFVGRGNTVMLWVPETWNHTVEKYGVQNVGGVLFEQIRHTFLGLHLYGDESPHFALARPMVSAITAALFTLGAGLCVRLWRDPRCFALLAWIGLTFILGGVLTSDPPYWPHLNIALPAIMLVAGLAADRLGRVVFRTGASVRGGIAFGLLLAAALGWNAAHSWQVYRGFATHTDDPRVQSARYIQQLPEGSTVYLIDPVIGWDMYSFKFLDRRVRGVSMRPEDLASRSNLPPADGRTTFIVFRDATHAGGADRVQMIADAYNGERVERHNDVAGNLVFTSIEVNVRATPPPDGTRMPREPWNLPGWRLVSVGLLAVMLLSLHKLQSSAESPICQTRLA